MGKQLEIATVKITRNPKVGCVLYVKSPTIARFFEREARNHGVLAVPETIYYGAKEQPIIVSGLLRTRAADYSVGFRYYDHKYQRAVVNGDYTFLMSPALADGIKVGIDGPLAEDSARQIVSGISGTLRDLYVQLIRSYVVETTLAIKQDEL